MQRFVSYMLLVLLALVYTIATIPEFTRYVRSWKLLPDLSHYGDLYNISYLPKFKELHKPCEYLAPKVVKKKKVRLFILGDSFTESLKASDFAADQYKFIGRHYEVTTSLDSSWYNVLILETVERNSLFLAHPYNNLDINRNVKNEITKEYYDVISFEVLKRIFGIKIIEQNLEYLLFNNVVMNKLKEVKAIINYEWFNRTDPQVFVRNNKKIIYLKETIDSTSLTSSFCTLTNNEIDEQVLGVNEFSKKYRKEGFDAVYFSIIPNKVSICERGLGQYNLKITRVQDNKLLNCHFIDAYAMLTKLGPQAYYFNDTHWNCEGKAAWLDYVNKNIIANP